MENFHLQSFHLRRNANFALHFAATKTLPTELCNLNDEFPEKKTYLPGNTDG